MKAFSLMAALALLAAPLITHAAAPAVFQENVAYERILPPQPTIGDGKVEVVEVFWYGCPHCHRFQPFIERWLLTAPENVTFVRLPAILSERWAIHARAYYAAEGLGVLERIHQPLFDAIHVEKRRLDSERELENFFAEHGVDREEFRKAFNSFSVSTKVARARDLTRRYGIDATPAVVVNGTWRTGPGMVNSFDNVIAVVDHLVAREGAGN